MGEVNGRGRGTGGPNVPPTPNRTLSRVGRKCLCDRRTNTFFFFFSPLEGNSVPLYGHLKHISSRTRFNANDGTRSWKSEIKTLAWEEKWEYCCLIATHGRRNIRSVCNDDQFLSRSYYRPHRGETAQPMAMCSIALRNTTHQTSSFPFFFFTFPFVSPVSLRSFFF